MRSIRHVCHVDVIISAHSLVLQSAPSHLGLVRLALNPCGLSGIGWVWIPNKSNFFSIFSNPIQSMCIGNNRTSPYVVNSVWLKCTCFYPSSSWQYKPCLFSGSCSQQQCLENSKVHFYDEFTSDIFFLCLAKVGWLVFSVFLVKSIIMYSLHSFLFVVF
jgi:hypothetical protein